MVYSHLPTSYILCPNVMYIYLKKVREPLKCIVSRANRVGMMFSPINYASPQLFALLTHDFRVGLSEGTGNPPWLHQDNADSKDTVGEAAAMPSTTTISTTPSKGVRDSLEWLSPPPESERQAFEAMRKEQGWSTSKRLRIALFHFVYW